MHAVAQVLELIGEILREPALGLKAGDGVLVPTMTFAATAEVVRYQGAIPILVDSDPVTLNMDLEDAKRRSEVKGQNRIGLLISDLRFLFQF